MKPLAANAGSGVPCSFQETPFQTCARPTVSVRVESTCEPTASQKVAEGQDTALSVLFTAPAGVTAAWTRQELPLPDTARAIEADVLSWN